MSYGVAAQPWRVSVRGLALPTAREGHHLLLTVPPTSPQRLSIRTSAGNGRLDVSAQRRLQWPPHLLVHAICPSGGLELISTLLRLAHTLLNPVLACGPLPAAIAVSKKVVRVALLSHCLSWVLYVNLASSHAHGTHGNMHSMMHMTMFVAWRWDVGGLAAALPLMIDSDVLEYLTRLCFLKRLPIPSPPAQWFVFFLPPAVGFQLPGAAWEMTSPSHQFLTGCYLFRLPLAAATRRHTISLSVVICSSAPVVAHTWRAPFQHQRYYLRRLQTGPGTTGKQTKTKTSDSPGQLCSPKQGDKKKLQTRPKLETVQATENSQTPTQQPKSHRRQRRTPPKTYCCHSLMNPPPWLHRNACQRPASACQCVQMNARLGISEGLATGLTAAGVR